MQEELYQANPWNRVKVLEPKTFHFALGRTSARPLLWQQEAFDNQVLCSGVSDSADGESCGPALSSSLALVCKVGDYVKRMITQDTVTFT